MSHQYDLSHPTYENNAVLIPNSRKPAKTVEYINSYIEAVDCERVSVDISCMNLIDACYISALCSAKHYIKYPNGQINWYVSSNLVSNMTKDMSLGNSKYTIK